MAPEILRGDPDGPWSDVYGLASTLAAALIGTSPFARRPDERIEALITRKLMSPAPPLPASVPPALGQPIRRALDPDPTGRPSLIQLRQELAAAADRLGAGTPAPPPALATMPAAVAHDVVPAAPGETLSAQLRRGRRRRLAIALGVAVATAAAVVVAALFAAARRDGGRDQPTTRIVAPATASVATSTTPPSSAPPTSKRARVGPAATVAPAPSVADTAPPIVTAAPNDVTAPPTAPPTVETAGAAVPPATVTAATTTAPATADTPPSAGGQAVVTETQAEAFIGSYFDAVTARDYDDDLVTTRS